jgi:MtrB/PioB family decaheme-associated outer membrane protein
MKLKLIPLLVANVFAAGAVSAAEGDFVLSGSVGLGLRSVNEKANNQWKLREYRDLKNEQILSVFDLSGRGGSYWIDAYGENIGNDDVYLDVRGGQYGTFKYRLYGNELNHVFTTGARSPHVGVGTPNLTGLTAPNLNPNTWPSRFDYDLKRRDIGGNVEFSMASPFYVRVDANQVKREGLFPFAYAGGTSPGNGFLEVPQLRDWTDKNYSVEAGYSTRQLHASLSWSQSKFENDVPLMRFTNPNMGGGLDFAWQAPNNEATRIGANVMFKQLPMGSTLSGRFSQTKLTNSFATPSVTLAPGARFLTTVPSSPGFNGDVKNTSASLSLTSSPMRQLDTRLYWNWHEKDDDSTRIAYAAGTTAPATPTTNLTAVQTFERLSYKKNNLGFEAGYRVNPANKVSAGVDWTKTERDREDYDESKDWKYFVELRNSSLDVVEGRLRYQYMERRSNFHEPFATGTQGNAYFLWAVRRFDVASFDQQLVRLTLDATPAPLVDLGFEAIYKDNKYKDTILGRERDDRQEIYASVSYGDPRAFRVSLFGDVEWVQYKSIHRSVNSAACGDVSGGFVLSCDPNAPAAPNGNAFTWKADNKDKNWAIGTGAEWAVMPRLGLRASYIYSQTKGTVDFTGNFLTTFSNFPANITNYDNTRRHTLNLKAVYQATKQWEVTGGYAYEKFRYSDDQFDNYRYVVGTGANAGYLTGAYADPNYRANIVYVMARYRF